MSDLQSLPVSVGVGCRDTIGGEGCTGVVALRGRLEPEGFMCPESPSRDLKQEVRCSDSSYHNYKSSLSFVMYLLTVCTVEAVVS